MPPQGRSNPVGSEANAAARVQHSSAGRDINIAVYENRGATKIRSLLYREAFLSLIQDRVSDFVGREFVFARIKEALRAPGFTSGYVLVTGEPGIGKTSLMAGLVRRYDCVHHFNVSRQGITTIRAFLQNTCAQLILRYGLRYDELHEDLLRYSHFFLRLLAEAAGAAGGPVIVAIDALDECEGHDASDGANVLKLPGDLPEGVFVIATSRNVHDCKLAVTRLNVIDLIDAAPENLHDVRRYVRAFLTGRVAGLQASLQQWNLTPAALEDLLVERSEGNFEYLRHVLWEINSGTLGPDTLDDIRKLPLGLKSLYRPHWRQMKAADLAAFDRQFRPVLCLLAVLRGAITADWIAGQARLPLRDVKSVLRQWQQFLNVTRDAVGVERYQIYHKSFADFLNAEEDLAVFYRSITESVLGSLPGYDA